MRYHRRDDPARRIPRGFGRIVMTGPSDRTDEGGSPARPAPSRALLTLQRLVAVEPHELAAVAWAWLFFFSVLTAYYVIRPIRDDMGVAGGVQNLPWLFTGTLTGMALANPAFGYLTTRFSRDRVVSIGYRFFAANLLLFFLLFRTTSGIGNLWAGRVFFVWSAVFNMFVVSIFWSVVTDAFSPAQGRRLFGFIGAGGTIGAITGAGITSGLVSIIGTANLLLVSAALLEVAVVSAHRVFHTAPRESASAAPRSLDRAFGGHAWDGLKRTASEPYLRGIAFHVVLYTLLTTFIYFQQATIVDAAITDRVARTRFFANIELAVNLIALVTQMFATGRLVQIFGLTATLAYLPALSLAGFAALGAMPTVAVLMAFQVIRRASEFAVARPAREVLFTVTRPADRYQAKNFIDTFVYRAGDQIGAWGYTLLAAIGMRSAGISGAAMVLAVVSIGVALWLGRRQRALEHRGATAMTPSPAHP
jgi:AAA family ATP:ADP antiporter